MHRQQITGATRLRVIVAMQHTADGAPKIVKNRTLPITSMRPIDLVVAELAVILFRDRGATLFETGLGISLARVVPRLKRSLRFRTRFGKCNCDIAESQFRE
jgi:acyl CoA:acetate/3-ketoacid CoA transferase beta subunit